MDNNLITIAVTPRETFSIAKRSLESVFQNTRVPFQMIYIDGNSPSYLKKWLDEKAKQYSFKILRTEKYLTPNEARNIAIEHVTTPYVVFVDNDVVVSPGWLQALIDCAEETEAAVVGPLYCEFEPLGTNVHMAGGEAALNERFYEKHWHQHVERKYVEDQLTRKQTQLIEFHAVLVRMNLFDIIGPLDEKLMGSAEHMDFCVRAANANEKIYIEPKSIITHILPKKFNKSDTKYFQLRWSVAWNQATINHLQTNWNIPDDDHGLKVMDDWLEERRRLRLTWLRKLRKVIGEKAVDKLLRRFIIPIEKTLNQWKVRPEINRERPRAYEVKF